MRAQMDRTGPQVGIGVILFGCLLVSSGLLTVGLTAMGLIHAGSAADGGAAQLPAMRAMHGLLLAGEILKTVLAVAFLVAIWTIQTARPIGSVRGGIGFLFGTAAGLLLMVAGRQGIVAAAQWGASIVPTDGAFVAMAGLGATTLAGLWAALTAYDLRLPGWMRMTGLALAALGFAAVKWPLLGFAFGGLLLVWWLGLFHYFVRPART